MDAKSSTPEELMALSQRDYQRWGLVIQAKNISAD